MNLKQDHTVQRRSCRRVPGGARLHDYWQQASKRGAAKEVRFPGFRPDGDGERRADDGGERDEAQMVREEGGGGRARRAVDRARSMHPSTPWRASRRATRVCIRTQSVLVHMAQWHGARCVGN